ncbi:IS66 family insertion sequence element accessory protein TnpB, partial [Mesorhizobium sp. M0410]|uniref:IS66 family insertion sequence element accessory protein TnpB n=1 Tax=Mesorhizobium sp. M0410 TaxID=2956943 RepID=UPI00333D7D8D
MIPVPSQVRIWLAVGRTDMRRGMQGLALQVQETLGRDPHAGDLYVFRGRSGQLSTFCIWFPLCDGCLSLASVVWEHVAG